MIFAHNTVATRRVALTLGGMIFDTWTRVEITRDLSEISGSFSLELVDTARSAATLPYVSLGGLAGPAVHGLEARITIDGEPVLVGWVDDVNPQAGEGWVSVSVVGRDKTGDLVDCAATVEGPSEFKGLDLKEIAEKAVEPFGLTVRADVDVGEPFERFTFDPGETAMSAIEKGARRRALLVTSDGLGAVVLTRSGQEQAPGILAFPGNVAESGGQFSARERFSDYHVKGQAEGGGGIRAESSPLDATAAPLGASGAPSLAGDREEGGVAIHGHAQDPEITRYRPTVSLARTQTTSADAETQADWMMRTAKAQGEKLDYLVVDWRANGALWRPNQRAFVDDAFQQVHREMLIAGVVYAYDERGTTTQLRLTGPEAYDLLPEGEEEESRRNLSRGAGRSSGGSSGTSSGGLDGTAYAL